MKEQGEDLLTFQARPRLPIEIEQAFDRFGGRYGRDQRRLNRMLDQGAEVKDAKKLFIREGLTARQFNAMAIGLKGDRASRAASHRREIADKERRIKAIEKKLKGGEYAPFVAHQKRRKVAKLKTAVESLKTNRPRMTFGGWKLWKAQHELPKNGYASHDEWLKDWRASRSSGFFLVGSKDETRGNQSCQYDPILKELAIRLPDAYGGRIVLKGVVFPYGHEIIEKALFLEQAITYRFVRKEKGWYVMASTERPSVERATDLARGAIGVDAGPGLIAAVETDARGNPVRRKTYPFFPYKKTKAQVKAMLEEIAIRIGEWAEKTGKPVVIEDLDFERKKAQLKELGKGYARMLSGFAYERTALAIRSRCARLGVEVIRVNAAFSSVIGIVKFASMYGLSGDEAAALALARRGLRLKESLPAGTAFDRPEDRPKHVWSHWRRLGKALRLKGRHAFIAAARRSGGGPRVYPAFPARAAPA